MSIPVVVRSFTSQRIGKEGMPTEASCDSLHNGQMHSDSLAKSETGTWNFSIVFWTVDESVAMPPTHPKDPCCPDSAIMETDGPFPEDEV